MDMFVSIFRVLAEAVAQNMFNARMYLGCLCVIGLIIIVSGIGKD